MIILSIATSGTVCSVAVTDDDGILVETTFRHRMQLSVRLVGDVETVLEDAGIDLNMVDAFAVDIGPGSFTGVRIGVTAVKTWADILRRPVVGVGALEGAAFSFFHQCWDVVVPIIRARPGAVYAARYGGDGEILQAPEMLTTTEVGETVGGIAADRILITGESWSTGVELFGSGSNELRPPLVYLRSGPVLASTIARIAKLRLGDGRTTQALDLVPLYVAPPPIGQKKREA